MGSSPATLVKSLRPSKSQLFTQKWAEYLTTCSSCSKPSMASHHNKIKPNSPLPSPSTHHSHADLCSLTSPSRGRPQGLCICLPTSQNGLSTSLEDLLPQVSETFPFNPIYNNNSSTYFSLQYSSSSPRILFNASMAFILPSVILIYNLFIVCHHYCYLLLCKICERVGLR